MSPQNTKLAFNSLRVLLQPPTTFPYVIKGSCFQFSSSLIATQGGDGDERNTFNFQFSSSLIATPSTLCKRSLLTCFQFSSSLIATTSEARQHFPTSSFQFSSSLIATWWVPKSRFYFFDSFNSLRVLLQRQKGTVRLRKPVFFQFSSSLIATLDFEPIEILNYQLSILFESYCNRADFPSVRPTGSCTFLYI